MRPPFIYQKSIFFLTVLLILSSCHTNEFKSIRKTIDLAGTWQLKLDSANIGTSQRWFASDYSDSVLLPGSLDQNKKGKKNTDSTIYHLNRDYIFEGAAWYRKEISIPEDWKDKQIDLVLERTKVTQVWIDTVYAGTSNNIFSPQIYKLTGKLIPGKHFITIRIDNTATLVPVAGSHAFSEDTQTNWNGVIGCIKLEASEQTRIESVRITPDVKNKKVLLNFHIKNNQPDLSKGKIVLEAQTWNSKIKETIKHTTTEILINHKDSTYSLIYPVGDKIHLWSEFDPVLYKMNISLVVDGKTIDNQVVDFGMREFKQNGKQFTINGLTTFLRGKHDACVFPLTGYPPMDTAGWLRVFKIAKEYGINFYRFHTWTPPEAAFKAADMAGIYMQPELPAWWGLNVQDSSQLSFLLKEGKNIMDNYANHPSFVMFSLGNELFQERDSLRNMLAKLRSYDPRPLYAHGSNNRLWDPSYAAGDDFWASFRTGKEADDLSTDVRMSISFVDSREGGILNTIYPNTTFTYSKAIEKSPVPVVGFEVGQYQIYPPYKTELPKYTGVLKPWNLEIYRNKLEEKGMLDQAEDFFKASGALSMICYRAEIETAIRTPGFGGFQLLDLQDYPGQGTALVGVLDAFMESKGLISSENFRQFCNPVVLLLEMDKYCWSNKEVFSGKVKIADYGPADLVNKRIHWKIVYSTNEAVFNSGELDIVKAGQGKVESAGEITADFSSIQKATKLLVRMAVAGENIKTEYPLWIYPKDNNIKDSDKILIVTELNNNVQKKLEDGASVILFPDFNTIQKKSVPGMFIPEFWNYMMFNGFARQRGSGFSPGTLGLLMNELHPVFNDFPTEFHSNWQWWSITKNSRPIILDETDHKYRPIVQVIDNINRNHKLGLIFEFKVGKGKILICPVNFNAVEDRPEARQLYGSIIKYVNSDDFNPTENVAFDKLKTILY